VFQAHQKTKQVLSMKITEGMMNAAKGKRPWDLGNKTLYGLCKDYPGHRDEREIIAKIWLIGRAYSASI